MSQNIKNISLIISVFFALLLLNNQCHNVAVDNKKPVDQKRINKEINILNSDNTKKQIAVSAREKRLSNDSLNLVSQINYLKKAYLNALKKSPDTCKSYINTVYVECNKNDSIGAIISIRKDSTINDLSAEIFNFKKIDEKKDSIIFIKSDSIKIVKSLIKHSAKKWFKIGFITGSAITETANILLIKTK